MSYLRFIYCAMLIVTMLPWGAYAGSVGPAPMPPQIVAVEIYGETAAAAVVNANPSKQPILAMKRNECRVMGFSGAPCVPDRALENDAPVLSYGPRSKARMVVLNWRIWGRSIVPPKAPPRFV